jgi:hypothetical protein
MAWQEPIEEDIVPQQQRPGETKPTTGGAALLCKPTAVLSSYLNDISFASYASVTCPTLGYSKFPICFSHAGALVVGAGPRRGGRLVMHVALG